MHGIRACLKKIPPLFPLPLAVENRDGDFQGQVIGSLSPR